MCPDARRSSAVLLLCVFFAIASSLMLVSCGGGSSAPNQTQTAAPSPSGNQPAPGGGSNNSGGTGASSGGSGTPGGGTSGGNSGGGTSSGNSATTAALAYVAGGNGNFYGIRVDSASNISTVSGSPYSVPAFPNSFATTGNLLFVSSTSSDFTSGTITGFRADSNGVLTQLGASTLKSGGGVMIALDASGKFLYATASITPGGPATTSGAVFGFSVNQNTGALTALSGSPFYLSGGMGPPSKPKVAPNGSWLCVDMELARTNEGAQCYPRHADGSIDGVNFVQPAVSNTSICGLTISADSTHVLYTDCEQSVFSTLISPTRNGNGVSSRGSGAGWLDVDPSGPWAVATNSGSDSIAIFAIGAGDTLAAMGTPAATPAHNGQVTFSRSGTYTFVTSQSGTLIFSFNPTTGALTPLNASQLAPGSDGPLATM